MKAYCNGSIFTGEKWLKGVCILVKNNKIVEIVAENNLPSDAERVDLQGNMLAPAFIDLQIYGGNGLLFGEHPSVEALDATYNYCRAGGAAYFMPTVATHSRNVMFAAMDAVKEYQNQGKTGVLGLHLEGPYINSYKRGAHLSEFIREYPSLDAVKKLLEHADGVVKMMTLAPEVVSEKVLDVLQKNGVTLSIGHSNATFAEAKTAFAKGVHAATHLFNAMSPFHHRWLGVVGAIYSDSTVCASIVADGHHVDFDAIKLSKSILKERLFLITDAVTANPIGRYTHRRDGEKYVIPDTSLPNSPLTLSGSSLTMLKAVQNCVEKVNIPLEEALRMAALYPAKVIGLDHQLGRIEVGYAADFVVLDKALKLVKVEG